MSAKGRSPISWIPLIMCSYEYHHRCCRAADTLSLIQGAFDSQAQTQSTGHSLYLVGPTGCQQQCYAVFTAASAASCVCQESQASCCMAICLVLSACTCRRKEGSNRVDCSLIFCSHWLGCMLLSRLLRRVLCRPAESIMF